MEKWTNLKMVLCILCYSLNHSFVMIFKVVFEEWEDSISSLSILEQKPLAIGVKIRKVLGDPRHTLPIYQKLRF